MVSDFISYDEIMNDSKHCDINGLECLHNNDTDFYYILDDDDILRDNKNNPLCLNDIEYNQEDDSWTLISYNDKMTLIDIDLNFIIGNKWFDDIQIIQEDLYMVTNNDGQFNIAKKYVGLLSNNEWFDDIKIDKNNNIIYANNDDNDIVVDFDLNYIQ